MSDAHAPVVVLQTDGGWRRFANPVRVIVAETAASVAAAIRKIERAVEEEGLYAAGYLAYEAGAAYGLATHAPDPDAPPSGAAGPNTVSRSNSSRASPYRKRASTCSIRTDHKS